MQPATVTTLDSFRALPPEVQQQAWTVRARDSLVGWCYASPPTELGPMRPYPWQRDYCKRLEGLYRWAADRGPGKVVRVVLVDAPPQSGKSQITSRQGPSWAMAALGLSVAIVSYGASLAVEHSIAARGLMRSEQARAVWPHLDRTKVSGDTSRDREDDWTAPAREPGRPGVRCLARGRDGALTGRAVDLIVLDDMYKDAADYESLASRRQVDSFLRTSALARVMERGGAIVDMGTRWGVSDTKGWWAERVKELEAAGLTVQIEHWSYPLRGDEEWRHGEQGYITDGWTAEKEATARVMYGRHARAILDCDPDDIGGGLYPTGCLDHTYPETPRIAAQLCSATYITVDPAETQDGGDHTVIQRWGVRDSKSLLLGQRRGQWDSLGVVREVREAIAEWRPSGVLIEDTSAGKVALAALRQHIPGVVPVKVSGQGSKRDRIQGTILLWSTGDVLLPEPGPGTVWCYERDADGLDLRGRLYRLRGERPDMRGEVDDEADAATIFLRWRLDQGDTSVPTSDDVASLLAMG